MYRDSTLPYGRFSVGCEDKLAESQREKYKLIGYKEQFGDMFDFKVGFAG